MNKTYPPIIITERLQIRDVNFWALVLNIPSCYSLMHRQAVEQHYNPFINL